MNNKELDLDTPAAADDSKEVNFQENIEEAPQNATEPPVAEADTSEGENAESALGQESLDSKPEEQTSAPEAVVDKTKQKDLESDKTKPADLEPKETESRPKKKKTGTIVLAIIIAMLLIGTGVVFALMSNNGGNNGDESQNLEVGTETEELKEEKKEEKSYNLGNIVLSGNDINDFDLAILKIENDNKNIVYSPLSIKYALAMLNEGASGSSKEQIEKVIGTYNPKTYTNSANLSLANSLFVNSNYKDAIKEAYKTSLQNKYNAELLFDTFETPDNMNGWIENKTLGLIKNTIPNTNPKQDIFYLINALGIDMEWKQKIGADKGYSVSFKHVSNTYNSAAAGKNSADVAATAFKYDFMKELGEDGIRNEVKEAYDKWAEENKDVCSVEKIAEYAPDLDEYVSTLSSHYGHFSKSTDFEFYDDDNVQLFAKDLKEYDGTTLQYVSILPKNGSLEEYIENVSASEIGELIGKLKPVETESFDEGVVTILGGHIPFFKFDYQPEFKDDLIKMGITDIFDSEKADLGGISDTEDLFIGVAIHKANIDFSNEGIKAGAVTVFGGGGRGAGGDPCSPFYYNFEVPTKRISLDFSSPFLFLIRDKDSGEIWFTGSVYEPNKD